MNIKQFLVFLLGLLLVHELGLAQDPHFSQFFNSPLLLNPGYTGNGSASSRLGINYRQQWRGIGDPFVTGVVSYDRRILEDKLSEGDFIGIGFLAMYDKSSAGALTSSYGILSLAYQKSLGYDGNQRIGLGFQGTLGNRRLDYNKISFFNQFAIDGFDLTLNNGENFSSSALTYFDFNFGGVYAYDGESTSFSTGVSYYHVPRPEQKFLGDTAYKLPSRLNINYSARFNTGVNGRISSTGLFMQQGKVSEITLGMAYCYFLREQENTCISLGLWHRFKESIFPYIEFSHKDFLFALTYDITVSKLNLANTKNYSFEVSMNYNISNKK